MPTTYERIAIGWRWSARAVSIAALVAINTAVLPSTGDRSAVAQDAGSPDAAGHPAVDAAARKAIAASKQFVEQTKDVFKTGEAPRQTDPAIGRLLDAVFDVGILQKTHVSDADGSAVAEWLLAAVHVGSVYVGAGTGIKSVAGIARDRKALEQSDRNVASYAPEVGRYLDSEIVLETALLGTVLTGGPEPEDAMLSKAYGKMRSSLEITVSSVLKTLALPGVDYEWRLARLALLDASAPKIASLLDAGRCKQLHETVTLVAQKVRDSRVTDKLAAFNDKLTCAKG